MTASEYRYIQAIVSVKKEKGRVTMSDIAQKLAFARASVYKKLLSLGEQGYIVKEDGKYVGVTKKGETEYDAVGKLANVCAEMLAEKTGLEKKFLIHDAVNIACVLSSRCRNRLLDQRV